MFQFANCQYFHHLRLKTRTGVEYVGIYCLTIHSYYAIYIPVHPGRGLGHDGDHRWGGCGACGFGETDIKHSGADGWSRGYYGPLRLKWLNNPSGKPQTPCDLGLCKCQPDSKNRRKSVDADFASPAGRHDRHSCESLRPRNPSLFFLPSGNGITVFTPGGAVPNAH
jgi:hypothetical protein